MKNVRKKALLSLLLLPILTTSAHSAFDRFSIHSRGNCAGFNESISWEYGNSRMLLTYSKHINPKKSYSCYFNSGGWANTWRSAALHFAEGYGDWAVWGYHYGRDRRGNEIFYGETYSVDCSGYNGWWDHDK